MAGNNTWLTRLNCRTSLISLFSTGFMAGLVLSKLGAGVSWQLIALSLLGLMLMLLKSRLAFAAVLLIALSLGIWRGQAHLANYAGLVKNYGSAISVMGRVADDPLFTDRYQTEFHLNELNITDAKAWRPVGGKLRIRGFPGNKLRRGDLVRVSGKLYPILGSNQGQVSFAEVKILARSTSPVESVRQHFFAGIYTALPEPEASLGLGFLVGARALLPESLLTYLGLTGLTHIVAASGYNLTILVRFARRLLARYSKYLAMALSIALIFGFLAMSGISPSIFRASLVSGLALAAWYYGRQVKPSILILLPAAITAGLNPSYIWGDIGWYLSFLAFFGVLVIAPMLLARLSSRGTKAGALTQVLVESLSAQIMVMPLIAYIFGEASLISPLANLVILPLIPLAMLLTFVAGIAGIVFSGFAGWLAWPAKTLLLAMVKTIVWLADLPFAAHPLKLGLAHLVFCYLIIAWIILILHLKTKNRAFKYSIIE